MPWICSHIVELNLKFRWINRLFYLCNVLTSGCWFWKSSHMENILAILYINTLDGRSHPIKRSPSYLANLCDHSSSFCIFRMVEIAWDIHKGKQTPWPLGISRFSVSFSCERKVLTGDEILHVGSVNEFFLVNNVKMSQAGTKKTRYRFFTNF